MFGKKSLKLYSIALLLDALDWILIGEIPILGEVIDGFGIYYFQKRIGSYAFISSPELLSLAEFTGVGAPLAVIDVLPLFTVSVFIWDLNENKK